MDKDKAEKLLEKHVNENDLNFLFHDQKQMYNEVINALNEALGLAHVVNRREQLVAFSEWLSERDFTCDMTSPEDWVDMFLKSH